jgi:NADH-quinone oxidoreductase subunit C
VRYADGRDSEQFWLRIPAERLIEIARFARDDARTKFEQLCDLTAIDYLDYPDARDRFAVIYSLLSLTHNHRLWLKVFVNDPDPEVPSVTSIWRGAEWPEREVFDLFGIRFAGHPDLRRILCPPGITDHPLRKDYPLRGKGERRAFEVVRRDTA